MKKKAINPKTIEAWYTKTGVDNQRRIDEKEERLGVSFFPPDWQERLAAKEKKRQDI